MTRTEVLAQIAESFGLLDGHVEPETLAEYDSVCKKIRNMSDQEFSDFVERLID